MEEMESRLEQKDIIKGLRNKTGMSRREFADYFGIPYRTVQDWELGNRHMPDYLLQLIEYKLTMEKMMTGRRYPERRRTGMYTHAGTL